MKTPWKPTPQVSDADQKLQLYVKQAVGDAFVEAFAPEQPVAQVATTMLEAEERRAIASVVHNKILFEIYSISALRSTLNPAGENFAKFHEEKQKAQTQIEAAELRLEAIKKVRDAYAAT